MGNEHYGKFADVWKHLLLCAALSIELPRRYVESSSAFAQHPLSLTPEQVHGIFRFLERGGSIGALSRSPYYRLELDANREPGGSRYLGSPGLAIRLLASHETSFTFFDLDQAALRSIEQFAVAQAPPVTVGLRQQDSSTAIREMLTESSIPDFLFFDPYDSFTPDAAGDDYFELFLRANELGAKGMLWYGFHSVSQRQQISRMIASRAAQSKGGLILDAAINLSSIRTAEKLKNPGVFGCGMVCANLGRETRRTIHEVSKILPAV